MKKLIVLSTIFFLSMGVFAQKGLNFEVSGVNTRTLKKAQLNNLQTLGDIIEDYPVNWIDEYETVEITATNNGKPVIAWSENEVLSNQQKAMLGAADIGSNIVIKVIFKDRNSVTNILKKCNMNITYTVVPEYPAEYPGGKLKMTEYFQRNVMGKIPAKLPKEFKLVRERFIIDEQGSVSSVRITESSGYEKMDKMLLDVIKHMPRWTPAQDINGEKTKQEFQFSLGNLMEGC